MLKKGFLIFSLVLLILLAGLVSAGDNQSEVISDGSFDDIQIEIDNASSQDTIYVEGYHSGENGLNVNKNLKFEGKDDAVFDGKDTLNIMFISDCDVEISNVSFKNSKSYSIYSKNANLTVSGCSFEGCHEDGISFYGDANSKLIVRDCIFRDNYHGISIHGDNFDISASNFSNHDASAVSVYGSNGKIRSCEFADNSGFLSSCICVGQYDEYYSNINISGCSFRNSYAPVYLFARGVVIEKSKFISNRESAITLYGLNQLIADCEFTGNTASTGAAIQYLGSSSSAKYRLTYEGTERFIVKNSVFRDNSADDSGAAIYYNDESWEYAYNVGSSFSFNINEGLVDNCTFINNVAGSGGAIEYGTSYASDEKHGQYSRVTISNSRFTNNRATGDSPGGAIEMWGSNNKVLNCEFDGNSAGDGACIYSSGSNFKIDGCTFKNSRATSDGGAVYYTGTQMTITNSLFENLNAKSSGGAVAADIPKTGKLTITATKFIKNTAETGGALSCEGKLTVSGCEFTSNSAGRSSAAIDSSLGRAEISDTRFTSNTAPFGVVKVSNSYSFKNNQYSKNSNAMFFIGSEGDYKILSAASKKVTLIVCKITKSKKTFKIKLTHKYTKKPLNKFRIIVREVHKGAKKVLYTNSKGIAKFKSKDTKIQVKYDMPWYDHDAYPKIKAKVKAPKVKNKFKKSAYFKIKAKVGKKPLKKVKIKLEIDKKTYVVKTSKKGVAKFNTKRLAVGKHNVKITSGDSFYKISAKSVIKIKK